MANDLPHLPFIQPGRYRHYKGGEYEVLGVVRHSESLEPLVLYRPLHGGSGSWVRPFAMFLEPVEHAGTTLPRFSPVTEVDAAIGEDLATTVQRMEAALAASEDPLVQHLLRLYAVLAQRLAQDPAHGAREASLAQAGALMLVHAAAQAAQSS